jgi:beta-lactam-binding protein with PASTA domain
MVALGAVGLVTACALASCSHSPAANKKSAERSIRTTTSSTTTTSTPPTSTTTSTTTVPGVAVPNVIGLKITAARTALQTAGFPRVELNAPCNKGTLASQSVVSSLSVPGKAPDVRVGAVPVNPGAVVAPGTRIGITWSGCYGDKAEVPDVVGQTLAAARHALHVVGLTWACYTVGADTTTTTTSDPSTSTTRPAVTTTTAKAVQTVLTQTPAAHTILHPGAIVSLTMHRCPQ